MAIIGVSGWKGGIGKTTLTANLAAELVALGRKVAVLDADPQQSLVAWAGLGQGVLSKIVTAVATTHPERFREAVETAAKSADRVMIDSPPGVTDPALLAALVSDVVLLPAGPSPLDLVAVRGALDLARDARKQRGGKKPAIYLVPARVMRTVLSRDLAPALEELGEQVLPPISQRVAVAEAVLFGLTAGEYAPGSMAHEEFKALSLAVEEVLR